MKNKLLINPLHQALKFPCGNIAIFGLSKDLAKDLWNELKEIPLEYIIEVEELLYTHSTGKPLSQLFIALKDYIQGAESEEPFLKLFYEYHSKANDFNKKIDDLNNTQSTTTTTTKQL